MDEKIDFALEEAERIKPTIMHIAKQVGIEPSGILDIWWRTGRPDVLTENGYLELILAVNEEMSRDLLD